MTETPTEMTAAPAADVLADIGSDAHYESPKVPALRHYFIVSDLPYELDTYQLMTVVGRLASEGAASIVIERRIVDDNQASSPEPLRADEILTDETQ